MVTRPILSEIALAAAVAAEESGQTDEAARLFEVAVTEEQT